MKNQDTYKNKVQNLFTAYVLRSVEGKRMKYLAKPERNLRELFRGRVGVGTACGF